MPKPADLGGKRLIGLAPDAWLQWVTDRPDVTASEPLATEFQWISRDTDVVIPAFSPELGRFVVVNELQLRYNGRVPVRVQAYAALAEERCGLPIYPVLVNILPPGPGITVPARYESEFLGLSSHRDYRVLNLWEVDVDLVFREPLPSLLPFTPVLRGGGDEGVVRQALNALRAEERLSELEPLLAFFASFVLDIPVVQRIMRWDMAVLHESPWYEEILQQGLQQGMQQGTAEGIELGVLKRAREDILDILGLRLGPVPQPIVDEVNRISDADVLRRINRAAATAASMEEFQRALGA